MKAKKKLKANYDGPLRAHWMWSVVLACSLLILDGILLFRDQRSGLIALIFTALYFLAVIWLWPAGDGTQTPTAKITTNDDRVAFLANLGWDVTVTPTETMQVRIPENDDAVFRRYNDLQKSQGYDLSAYSGKAIMRYVYRINNYPGATEPVYATLLISKNQVIGGDITDTSAGGAVQGFKKAPEKTPAATTPPETKPAETTPAA